MKMMMPNKAKQNTPNDGPDTYKNINLFIFPGAGKHKVINGRR